MFAYYPEHFFQEPKSSPFYSRTRNFPCSYHNNYSPFYNPFYNHPASFYCPIPQEHEREQEERLKRFYENKARQQAKQSGASTFTSKNLPKKSFRVKIQGDEEEEKNSMANKSRAARKIFNFIKNQSTNKRTRKILNKLHTLGIIEDELKQLHETKNIGNLTLTFKEENWNQILSISIENKRFLEYEDKIVKLFDKLDGIQSEGIEVIRERRKHLVKFAQNLLDELDNQKENQWKIFIEKRLNSEVLDENSEENQLNSDNSDMISDEALEATNNSSS